MENNWLTYEEKIKLDKLKFEKTRIMSQFLSGNKKSDPYCMTKECKDISRQIKELEDLDKSRNGTIAINAPEFSKEYIPTFTSHKSNQELADKMSKEISSANIAVFNKRDADYLYQINTNPNLQISLDASYLGKIKITGKKFEYMSDGRQRITVVPTSKEIWAVTGTLTLVKRKDGTYGVLNDIYDYDIKSIDSAKNGIDKAKLSLRNIETESGSPSCDEGSGCTKYSIKFKGNISPDKIIGLPK